MGIRRRRRLHAIMLNIFSLVLILGSTQSTLAQRVDSGVPGMIFEHSIPVTMSDGIAIRGTSTGRKSTAGNRC